MRDLAIAAVVAVSVVAPACAHDVAWYRDHDTEREAVIRACRNDARYARTAECANAEQGQTAAWSRQLQRRDATLSGDLYDPRYYAGDGLVLQRTLNECNTRPIFVTPGMCEAARKGAALRGR